MAISSVLNPQNIIGNRKGTAEQFQNFITGGNNSLGSSIVNSTSLNKIVPFERGGVRPVTPDFNSIISSISTKTDTALDTNIKNQDNKVQGVVNNIQNVFQTTLQNFTKGYQEKLKSIEDSKPSGILEKFFGLYNNVTGFIQFFGDRKNLNKISTSLKGLRGLFEDSFETAKLIRKTINKIVKQLSSLPVATPSGGGGFNLDIKVPGSPLKNAAGKMLGGGRGKMLALGAGALGTGIAAGSAINALSGSENIQPAVVQQSIPENLADSLTSIIDRFVNAIDSLIKSAGEKPKSTSRTSGGGSSGGAPKPSPSLDSGKSSYTPGTIPENVKKDSKFTGGVTELAKKYNVPEDYLYAVMGFETGGTFDPAIRNKAGSGATGLIQFMPATARGLGTTTEELSKMDRGQQLKYVDKYFQGTLNKGASLSDVYMSVLMPAAVGKPDSTVLFGPGGIIPEGYTQNSGLDLNRDGKVTKAEATKKVEGYLPKENTLKPTSISPAQVAAAPTQTKAKADAISQPVKSQSNVTNLSMPAEVSSVGGQSQGGGGGGGGSAPPPPSGGSPSVPFLPAGNVDNFLVLYSKMVYNIVDG